MKNTFLMMSLVVAALSGCAGTPTAPTQVQAEHQHDAAAPAATHSHGDGMRDMKAMCEMHRQARSNMTMAEHQAMMDKMMPGMTAEQKQQRMKMMDEHCKQ